MKEAVGRFIVLLSVMIAVGFLYVSTSAATQPWVFLKGTVEAVSGDTVTIQLEGDFVPRPGNKIDIGFATPDGDQVSVGNWKVNKINKDWTVEAGAVKAVGEPNIGMYAVISSDSPRTKEEVSKELAEETDLHGTGVPGAVWTGTWNTNFKQVVLTHTGSLVTGHYVHDKGRIDGQVSGRTLRGTWSEEPSYAPPKDAGDFEFTLSSDGRSFSGRWRYGSSGDWKKWNGTRDDTGQPESSSQTQTPSQPEPSGYDEQMKQEQRQRNLEAAEKRVEELMDLQNKMIKNRNK